jgi:hypothetical protein
MDFPEVGQPSLASVARIIFQAGADGRAGAGNLAVSGQEHGIEVDEATGGSQIPGTVRQN